MVKRALVTLLCFGVCGAVLAGDRTSPPAPFGIRMGTPVAALAIRSVDHRLPFLYELSSVPVPNAYLQTVVVQATPKSGVCVVEGLSSDITTNRYGDELGAAFWHIEDQIDRAYGRGRGVSGYNQDGGSVVDDRRHNFMLALLKKEWKVGMIWTPDTVVRWNPGLESIVAELEATSLHTGKVRVIYTFSNAAQCGAEVAEAQKKIAPATRRGTR